MFVFNLCQVLWELLISLPIPHIQQIVCVCVYGVYGLELLYLKASHRTNWYKNSACIAQSLVRI